MCSGGQLLGSTLLSFDKKSLTRKCCKKSFPENEETTRKDQSSIKNAFSLIDINGERKILRSTPLSVLNLFCSTENRFVILKF